MITQLKKEKIQGMDHWTWDTFYIQETVNKISKYFTLGLSQKQCASITNSKKIF